MKNHLQPAHCFLSATTSPRSSGAIKNLVVWMVITTLAFNTSAQSPDSWVQKNSLPATARATSFAFSIGDKGYVGGGLNFGAGGSLKDFWEYDPAADSWTQKANYGGGVCSGAVAFAIGDKGYALTGSGNLGKKKDIWEYDPLLNSWTQKTDLPATERNYAVAFALGTKGYLGTGYTSAGFVSLNDFWQFDPVANVWTQKANIPGPQRSSAVGFGIDGKGYLGTGDTCDYFNCFALNDFYCYDTLTNTWTQKASAGVNLRDNATSFVLYGKGYICTGAVNFSNTNDLIEYDPEFDTWTTRAAIPGQGKTNAVGFATGGHGYVGTGYDPFFNVTSDFYEYTPDTASVATHVNEISNQVNVSISPNPVTGEASFTIASGNHLDNISLTIFSGYGRRISDAYTETKTISDRESVFHFTKNDLPPGVYYYTVKSNAQVIAGGKFIVM